MPPAPSLPTYRVKLLPLAHEVDVELTLPPATAREPVQLQVATWVPGAYGFLKYGRDIFNLQAVDLETGASVAVCREGWQGFRVEGSQGGLRVSYRFYGYEPAWSELVGFVDHTHAVLLGTRYLHLRGYDGPYQVAYELPAGWRLHHPAGPRALDGHTFEYASFGELLDAPVVAGDFTVLQRDVLGVDFHFVFLDQAVGFASEVDIFVDGLERIIRECHDVFGSFPFVHYTFIFSFNPTAHWGLEHATSTMIGLGETCLVDPDQCTKGFLVSAHELFHAWNVCRLKPSPLARADLATGSFPDGLWLSEGFTRYYETLLCVRAGRFSPDQFFSNLVNYYSHLEAMPAYQRVSLVDSSQATFLNHNRYPGSINSTIDYYDKGMLVAFNMDVLLLTSEPEGSLDEAFRAFYEAYVNDPEGFTTADAFAFFGSRAPGMDELLRREVSGPGGLSTLEQLRRLGFDVKRVIAPYLGLVLKENTGPVVASVLDTSPAGQSGLAPEDELVEVCGFPFNLKALKWLIEHEPTLTLKVRRGHRLLTFQVAPAQRTRVYGLAWRGTGEHAALVRRWLKRPDFHPAPGHEVPLTTFENPHGVQTVV